MQWFMNASPWLRGLIAALVLTAGFGLGYWLREEGVAGLEARLDERGQRLAVTQAGLGYQITLARYRRGIGSRLEMTDAEVALRRSEFNHAQAAHDLLTTRARLDLAVGQVAHVDGPTSESAR